MELVIRNPTKQYPNKLAVDGVTLTLRPGCTACWGPTGRGKPPSCGCSAASSTPTGGDHPGRPHRRPGGLPGQPGLPAPGLCYYPGFTGMDFLLYLGALKGLPPAPGQGPGGGAAGPGGPVGGGQAEAQNLLRLDEAAAGHRPGPAEPPPTPDPGRAHRRAGPQGAGALPGPHRPVGGALHCASIHPHRLGHRPHRRRGACS